MCVYRVEKNRNYTVISNYPFQDTRLSLKAKGLLCYILTLPDDWKFSIRGLAMYCKEGVDAVRSAVNELESAGYLVRGAERTVNGKFINGKFDVFEHPTNDAQQASPIPDNEPYAPADSVEEYEADDEDASSDDMQTSEKSTAEEAASDEAYMDDPTTENPSLDEPSSDEPSLDEPSLENPSLVFPTQQNTNNQNTEKQNTYHQCNAYIYQSNQYQHIDAIRDEIRDRIGYHCLAQEYGFLSLDEIVELMLEVELSNATSMHIAGANQPMSLVRSRFNMLTSLHIIYVFDRMKNQVKPITNMRNYMLATLFRAPTTIQSYYDNQVRYDRARI